MNHVVILMIGWVVGQFAVSAVLVYLYQKDKENINYWQAVRAYFSKEVGNHVIAFAGLLVILFISYDYIDLKITRADLANKAALTWKEKAMYYQRTFAVIIGGTIQLVLTLAYKRGKVAIEKAADKLG